MRHIPNVAEKPQNITSTVNNFKSLIKKVYQKGCTQAFNNKKDQNIYFTLIYAKAIKNYLHRNKKSRLTFNNKQIVFSNIEII